MQFDLIIIDSTDIDLSIGLAQTLDSYKRLLKPGGILICEVDTGGPQKLEGFAEEFELIGKKFEHTHFFVSHGTAWVSGSIVFAFCSDTIHPMKAHVDWDAFRSKQIPLQFYNPAVVRFQKFNGQCCLFECLHMSSSFEMFMMLSAFRLLCVAVAVLARHQANPRGCRAQVVL